VRGSVRVGRHAVATRAATAALSALLAVGSPGVAVGAGRAEAVPAFVALSVASDPAGATVYVDGERQGATPVELKGLAPGDHRVTVVKDGFLDNSRVMSLRTGQSHDLEVKLTPSEATAARRPQVRAQQETVPPAGEETEKEKKKGGGKAKWIVLGLGVAGAGAAAYVLTQNDPPVAGTITATPAGTGMAGATQYSFTSNASDPDKDSLTYEWNFGDGSTGSGQTATHVYGAAGTYSVTLTVKDKKHSVTAPAASVTVARNMAGTWTCGEEPGFGATVSWNLTQSGSVLGGTMTLTGNVFGTVSGVHGSIGALGYPTVVALNSPSFTVGDLEGTFSVSLNGNTDAAGNTITGTFTSRSTALQPPAVSGPATCRR
jgi:PKD domain-containing protein/PEGA domain-containing protein